MSLERLFKPESIAVVGATQNVSSIGGMPIKLLQDNDYKGRIFPVNPKYSEIAGLKCYASISDIPHDIDMALLAVAAERVLPILNECVAKNVRVVDVFSSGFAEMGNQQGQEALLNAVKGTATRILGPNNQGMVNFVDGITAAFSPMLARGVVIPKGNVGIISQSSGLGFAVMGWAAQRGVGFSHIVTLGNQADIELTELSKHLLADPASQVVACIVEGFTPGADLPGMVAIAREKGKRLVFLKLGRTESGQQASVSHSGSLAGDAAVFEAFCTQSGIILVKDYEELVDILVGLQGKKAVGNRVAILTGAGGSGILATDVCQDFHLPVPSLTRETETRLRSFLPAFASVQNPIDFTAQVSINDKNAFRACLTEVSRDPNIDVLLISFGLLTGEVAQQFADDIVEVTRASEKPLWVFTLATEQPVYDQMRAAGVPVYPSPFRCVQALAKIAGEQRLALRSRQEAPAADKGVTSWTEFQSKQALRKYGVAVPRGGLATTAGQAEALAEGIGFPVVLKLMSPQITHKTDAGLVLLNVENARGVAEGYTALLQKARAHDPSAEIQGVLVEEMLPAPVAEVFLGIRNDKDFGPVLLFGLGGIFVEILGDIARRVLPLSRSNVLDMMASIKAYPLLCGYRGRPKGDLDALADLILQVCRLAMEERDRFEEMEINPGFLMAEGQGVYAGDALIVPR